MIAIHWFRQDLRLHDNPALLAASDLGKVLPIYILDDTNSGTYAMGSASQQWLYHSLQALNTSLSGKLIVQKGDPEVILLQLAATYGVQAIFWNRCYEPWQINRDQRIKKTLEAHNIQVKSYNSLLLWEPWNVLKQDGHPYKVFTPYYKTGCLHTIPPREPLPNPTTLSLVDHLRNFDVESPWFSYGQLERHWNIGEQAARNRFDTFIRDGLKGYQEGRNFPSKEHVSRLSPHLHFGEISPHYIWHRLRSIQNVEWQNDINRFCSELGWREFSYYLLYHFPTLPDQNLNVKFNNFPWCQDTEALTAWKQGKTGIPIVDAGMRELVQTGYMHNRIRMIVGSFLVKNLGLHWTHGANWFWECLVDADLANNSASWQWVSGCGVDAAPYFRIFNPVTQGHRFDPEGVYTKYFVPELQKLPTKYLFSPWEAPNNILREADIKLGETYPNSIVDLKESRDRALKAFSSLHKASDKQV